MESALAVARRIEEKAQVQYRVVGDVIELSRTGASGRIVVGDDTVTIELKIGLALRPMKKLIESKIEDYLSRFAS
jgi:putative polyhydroxyalkanoate system protein